ncbi:acyl-CoA dehydrogenase family protein [Bacillus piscicola]|uniref:acyl-CoA dehydrogenase family protein n=1 Tax=Bacillus piscicola TaxID=1632684 RepID=UPI001F08BADE|nr:acyl-CoA dehydrogenase family protein [Bacillus piscicola]
MSGTLHASKRGGGFLLENVRPEQVFTPEDFTEEHKMIAKTTEDFVVGEVVPQIEKIENQEFDVSRHLLFQAGELGLLGTDVPEKYSGLGLDKISSTLITEKFSRAGAFSLSHGAHVGIGSLPIVFFGNEMQKKKYLPALAIGEKIAAYALTEPSSGSDALGAKTTAVLNEEGTHYILNGEKQWITNSAFADVFIVYAKIDGEHFSAFIVERECEGVTTGAEELKMGIKGSSTRTLLLDQAKVPKENLLGEAGRGHIIAFNILNIGRYKLGAGCVGASKRALELAAAYATERKQFRTEIGQFPAIQEKLGTMTAVIFALESSVYRTGGLFEEKLGILTEREQEDGSKVAAAIAEYAVECSLNKVAGSEILDFVADEAVQIFGGYGYMSEYEIETIYRDSRINRIFEGTNEINRLLIPDTIMKKAMKNELPFLEKAKALQQELLNMMPEEREEKTLAQENALLQNAKKVFLFIAGNSVQKYGSSLEKEQELLMKLANIVNDVYMMESALIRTEKAVAKNGETKEQIKLLCTRVYCQEAMNRTEAAAKESLVHMEEGDTLRTMLGMLRKLTRHTPTDVIQLKRQIASRVLHRKGYPI